MRTRPLFTAAALTALSLLAGCDMLVEPEEGVRTGVISFYDDPAVAIVPETVDAGVPFDVSIRTYGNGCMRQGETAVQTGGAVVDVRPRDIHSGANVCTDILNIFEHVAQVVLAEPGTAVVRFHGLQLPEDVPLTIERTVVVR